MELGYSAPRPRVGGSTHALPAPVLVGLPIRDVEAFGPALAPALPRRHHGFGILAVEDEHDTLIGVSIRRNRRAVDEEAHDRLVRVVVVDGEQNRLLRRVDLAPGPVREEAVV